MELACPIRSGPGSSSSSGCGSALGGIEGTEGELVGWRSSEGLSPAWRVGREAEGAAEGEELEELEGRSATAGLFGSSAWSPVSASPPLIANSDGEVTKWGNCG